MAVSQTDAIYTPASPGSRPPANDFFARQGSVNELNRELLRFKQRVFIQHQWLEPFTNRQTLLNDRAYLLVKRIMDVSLVLAALPFVLPLILLCALLIKIEDPKGPVLFIQQRTGKGGRRFGMYKFRTMVHNAEELKKKYTHLNELQWPDFKITNDPRVTKFGRIMRKTSLDELPQLFNVLQGNMSLVGPRPTSFSSDTYAIWQTVRLDATPGITGLWQIIGRGAMEFSDRVHLDMFYIEYRCLSLDFQILIRTALAVLQQKGVH